MGGGSEGGGVSGEFRGEGLGSRRASAGRGGRGLHIFWRPKFQAS